MPKADPLQIRHGLALGPLKNPPKNLLKYIFAQKNSNLKIGGLWTRVRVVVRVRLARGRVNLTLALTLTLTPYAVSDPHKFKRTHCGLLVEPSSLKKFVAFYSAAVPWQTIILVNLWRTHRLADISPQRTQVHQ